MLRATRDRTCGLPLAALPLIALAALPFAAAAQAAAPEAEAPPQPPPAPADSPPPRGPASPADVRRAVYLPEGVKAQIREEIKKEVLAQARAEGWAAPNLVPRWLERMKLAGDVRGRFEWALFPEGADTENGFPDFAAINAGSPFDMNAVDLAGDKFLDVDQDRTRPRLRARIALEAAVAPGFTAAVRLASGEGSSPVSTNQSLGASGAFGKYQLWLDRAFLRAATRPEARSAVSLDVGRFENPFFATELLWADTVNLDGAAARGRIGLGDGLGVFLAGGAFPIYTTSLAFPADHTAKLPSRQKWLFAGQAGGEWRPSRRLAMKLGVAFYDFYGIEGRTSSPCDTHLKASTCDTDDTRPAFAQKGNTYRALRTPSPEALVQGQGAPEYQYFGLASAFRELAGTVRIDLLAASPLKVTADAELVRNLAFSRQRMQPSVAVNNLEACHPDGRCDGFAGGRDGWLARLAFGSPVQEERWSWSASFSYRHLESDAAVDAFTDPDFGLGGTNLEGFVVGASLAFAHHVTAAARFSSADSIAGSPYRVDVLQVDVTARF
jgi:hypothetical protein